MYEYSLTPNGKSRVSSNWEGHSRVMAYLLPLAKASFWPTEGYFLLVCILA